MVRWETKPLGTVCQLVSRGISPVYIEKSGVAVLNQKCVRDHTLNFSLGRRHDAVAKRVPADRFLRAGDVLVNSTGTGTLGRVAQLRSEPAEPTTVDSHVTIVRPIKGKFFPEFFGYALIAIEDQIQQGGEGCGGQTELSRLKLADDYLVSYPNDLDEQRRIVAILDEAFEGIDTAIANAKKNLANARELFDSYLNIVFGEGGDQALLSELATEITDGDHSPPPKAASGVPFITISDIVKPTRTIDFANTFFVPDAYFQNLKANKKPKVGDVLYTVTGATLGIPVLVQEKIDFCFQRHIGLIRPKPSTNSVWLSYALLSRRAFSQATVGSTGTAQKTVSLAVLRNIKVPKIGVKEQCALAQKLDALSAETQRLETVYQHKLVVLAKLKQAILQKAFAGELTAQSAERVQEAAE